MFEKIKYRFPGSFQTGWARIRGIAFLTAVTIASVTLLSHSIKTVNIFDGEKKITVYSVDNNIARVLSDLDLKSNQYKILKTTSARQSTDVEISYAFPVYITVGDETKTLSFFDGTVKDALSQAGITPDEYDMVEPSLDTEITETIYIDYTDISYVTGSYTEEIPFQTKTVYAADKSEGYTAQTAGSKGLREISYTEKYVNGTFTEKSVTGTKILKEAVDSVKTVGTKKALPVAAPSSKAPAVVTANSSAVKCISTLSPSKPIELDANGIPVRYKSKMTSRATAYTHTGHNCSTGVYPQPGYIAVNPKVIPYGTKMYIRTADGKFIYGYAVAADTGGFIKKHPTGVDLFMDTVSECYSFGVRQVEIYILE